MNIAGFLIPNSFLLNGATGTTPALEEGLPANFPFELTPPSTAAIAGGLTVAAPLSIQPAADLAGALIPSFGALFFNRIHVLPNVINVGNLANKQTREVEIFNAFIETTQTLETVTPNGNLSGVAFDATLPEVFAPFASKFFELTINSAGAPSFNGFFALEFDLATAPNLIVYGQRIIPFTFPHNWNVLPVENLEYLTKIYESRADYETAQKLRPFARRRLKYRHTAIESTDAAAIAEARAELESVLYSWLHRPFALPIWEDLTVLTGELAAGAETLAVQTVGLDFDAGGYVIFWRNSESFELIEIESVSSNSINLARPTEQTWQPATLVLPARLARLSGEQILSGETEDILEFETTWIIEPSQKSTNRVGVWNPPQYRTFPVWLSAFRLAEAIENRIGRKQTVFDYETGGRSVITSGVNPRGSFPAAAVNMNREEIAAFYGFLDQRAGKLNPCWFPSWANDAKLIATAGSAATSVTIAGNRFSNVYAAEPEAGKNRRDLMIRWKTGEMFFVRVESAEPINEISENLFLSAPLPRLLSPETVDRISFLKFARLEADNIELTKETTNVSRSEFILRELVAAE